MIFESKTVAMQNQTKKVKNNGREETKYISRGVYGK